MSIQLFIWCGSETAYLVANSLGYFAIVGQSVEGMVFWDQALMPPSDADFQEDDLDFDMF